ncbi:MAG: S-layer homology domain-containing protein, partial [Clostridia bacterium]|nr:S-layer homology domain-containing protein [Clostridia bacterium]
MKNLKRFISGSLATLMIVASMVTGASAKSYDDVTSTDRYAEQIEILSDIGVIKGTSENEFSPEEKVTREQMALLLFRLMLGKESAGTLNTTAFTDLYDDTYS